MAMLIGTTAADVAQVLTRITRRPVVYVSSVGDAASPVVYVAGLYSRQIGQCADWRHRVEDAARQHNAVYAEGSWLGDEYGWVVGIPDEYADAVCRELWVVTVAQKRARDAARHAAMVREMERREAERPALEAAAAAYRAECEARAAEYRPLYEAARARVRTTRRGPHRGDLNTLEWAYGKACGYQEHGCYGEYDQRHGLQVLTRLAEQGFADVRVTA